MGNGEIEVEVTSIPAFPAGLTYQDFSYSVYTGENPDPSNLAKSSRANRPGGITQIRWFIPHWRRRSIRLK